MDRYDIKVFTVDEHKNIRFEVWMPLPESYKENENE